MEPSILCPKTFEPLLYKNKVEESFFNFSFSTKKILIRLIHHYEIN